MRAMGRISLSKVLTMMSSWPYARYIVALAYAPLPGHLGLLLNWTGPGTVSVPNAQDWLLPDVLCALHNFLIANLQISGSPLEMGGSPSGGARTHATGTPT